MADVDVGRLTGPNVRFAADGSPSSSTNPLIDYHVIYAIALIVAAVTYAGNTWGLGRWWARRPSDSPLALSS
jgi:thiosulfate dehydrogenase [quinone] large subunit